MEDIYKQVQNAIEDNCKELSHEATSIIIDAIDYIRFKIAHEVSDPIAKDELDKYFKSIMIE
jgi:tRNA A37 threonylcarbamoyladenosine dehydratase